MTKIDNKKLISLKQITEALLPHIPEIEGWLKSRYFSISTRRPSWDANFGNKGLIKIGGIDIKVHAPTRNGYGCSRELKFGVRTGKDGLFDIDKLADKIKQNLKEIEEILELADHNIAVSERDFHRRCSNAKIIEKLQNEGVIKYTYEYSANPDGFNAAITLRDEEELRLFISFKTELEKSREVKA